VSKHHQISTNARGLEEALCLGHRHRWRPGTIQRKHLVRKLQRLPPPLSANPSPEWKNRSKASHQNCHLLVVSLLKVLSLRLLRRYLRWKPWFNFIVGLGNDNKVLFMESVVVVGAMFVFFLYFSQYFAPIC
jgi:hypothetical protein